MAHDELELDSLVGMTFEEVRETLDRHCLTDYELYPGQWRLDPAVLDSARMRGGGRVARHTVFIGGGMMAYDGEVECDKCNSEIDVEVRCNCAYYTEHPETELTDPESLETAQKVGDLVRETVKECGGIVGRSQDEQFAIRRRVWNSAYTVAYRETKELAQEYYADYLRQNPDANVGIWDRWNQRWVDSQ